MSRINRLKRQDEICKMICELGLAPFHLVLYFKISKIHLNFGSMLILVG
jgi:hypothetical protein